MYRKKKITIFALICVLTALIGCTVYFIAYNDKSVTEGQIWNDEGQAATLYKGSTAKEKNATDKNRNLGKADSKSEEDNVFVDEMEDKETSYVISDVDFENADMKADSYIPGTAVSREGMEYMTEKEIEEAKENGDLNFYTIGNYSLVNERAWAKLFSSDNMFAVAEKIAKMEHDSGFKGDWCYVNTLTFNPNIESGDVNYLYVDYMDQEEHTTGERHYYKLTGTSHENYGVNRVAIEEVRHITQEMIKDAQIRINQFETTE